MFTAPGRLIGFKVSRAFSVVNGYFVDDSMNTLYCVDDSLSTYLRFED